MKSILLACCLLLLSTAIHAADTEPLRPGDLHGRWVLAEEALTDEQADAAEAAQEVPGYGVVFTLRTARLKLTADGMIAGKWRLDDASEDQATLVIHPRGNPEQTFQLHLDEEGVLRIAELPGNLPLRKMQ